MKVAKGETVYSHGTPPCSGIGLGWTVVEFDAALSEPVATNLFDDNDKANIESILIDLGETNFEQDGLRRIFSNPATIRSWRVGEAIAETYLQDHRDCYFPWPVGRDERKSGSSLQGADLVGLGRDEDGDCFAFGEVKTSQVAKFPPGVMYDLRKQMEDLRDREKIRDNLFMYLGHRAKTSDWRSRFQAAAVRYLKNSSDVQLYGFLIRDVPPDCRDLRSCVQKLSNNCPDGTGIELIALYLPEGRIEGIGKVVIEKRTGGKP